MILISLFLFFLTYCRTSKKITGRANDIFTENDYKAGLKVVAQNDCLTCHMVKERNIGPSFVQIANRYERVSESVIQKLSNKIRKGGAGTWGMIPMPPHASLSNEETTAIVKYILLRKYK